MRHILFCPACKEWTMMELHKCGVVSTSTRPPKWSPEDKYASYRRLAKQDALRQRGLV